MSTSLSPFRRRGAAAGRSSAKQWIGQERAVEHAAGAWAWAGRRAAVAVLLGILVLTGGARAWSENAGGEPRPAATGTLPAGYRLGPGDQIHIDVFAEPDLATAVRITAHGLLSMPLIGEVAVIGRPVEDIAAEIQRRLEDGYVRHAPVSVMVVEYAVRLAYVMGSVNHQCAITLDPFSPTTAMQAIGKAGGFQTDANRRGTQVVRDDPEHAAKKLRLMVQTAATPEAEVKDIVLLPGDMVVVPQLDRIIVTGRVKITGALNLTGIDHLTLSKAISFAGGFDTYAKQTQVQLIREGEAIRVIDVQALLNGQRGDDPILLPGDTVVVPESRF